MAIGIRRPDYDCGNRDLTALMQMLADLHTWGVVSDAWFNAAGSHIGSVVPLVDVRDRRDVTEDDIENWLEVLESYSDPRDGVKALAEIVRDNGRR